MATHLTLPLIFLLMGKKITEFSFPTCKLFIPAVHFGTTRGQPPKNEANKRKVGEKWFTLFEPQAQISSEINHISKIFTHMGFCCFLSCLVGICCSVERN